MPRGPMHDRINDSPFDAPELMNGYPLDKRERAALEAATEGAASLAWQPISEGSVGGAATPFEAPLA
jgi:hypothetical protein